MKMQGVDPINVSSSLHCLGLITVTLDNVQ